MKLFKSLLVAPATIGLLAPFSTFAGEANLNDISKYSNPEEIDLANAFVNDKPNDKPPYKNHQIDQSVFPLTVTRSIQSSQLLKYL